MWWGRGCELGVGVCCQRAWLVKLNDLAVRKHHDFIALHNCIQTMGNRDHCTTLKLVVDETLDFLLSHNIYIGCGFIENDYFGAAKNGATNAYKLFLARR